MDYEQSLFSNVLVIYFIMFVTVLIYVVASPFLITVVTLMICHYISYDISEVRTYIGSVLLLVSFLTLRRLMSYIYICIWSTHS